MSANSRNIGPKAPIRMPTKSFRQSDFEDMPIAPGRYKGTTRIRQCREEELTKQELSRIRKGLDAIDLEIRADGRFIYKKASEGTYEIAKDRVLFRVETFGGQTLQQMRDRAEEANRTFGLAFLFDPFELVIEGDALVTPDKRSPLYVAYERG